jgi:hypothetical protein
MQTNIVEFSRVHGNHRIISPKQGEDIMARHYSSIFARGFAGIGEELLEISTRSGKSMIAGKVLLDDKREYLESLKPSQAAILEATTYANFAKMQDIYLERERETGTTAYNIALSDWFVAPKVLQINVDRWTGKPGQVIRVKARDNVGVSNVSVMICDADGKLLEAGEASLAEPGSAWWEYTTQTSVPLLPFPSVKAMAQDLPGNRASFTIS